LSGGQKQRVGIARALYSNADIIFLDEATSSLDPKTEQIILKNIKSIFKNKTIIMITHRRDILKFANKVFALSKGILKKIK
jgi:ABC-type bacteriocin/lantibiotic exporter with double-glycine peptidase domain